MRNCGKKLQRYDISDYDYHSPLDLITKYSAMLTDEVCCESQTMNHEYQQTTKTDETALLFDLVTKMIKRRKWFRYSLT